MEKETNEVNFCVIMKEARGPNRSFLKIQPLLQDDKNMSIYAFDGPAKWLAASDMHFLWSFPAVPKLKCQPPRLLQTSEHDISRFLKASEAYLSILPQFIPEERDNVELSPAQLVIEECRSRQRKTIPNLQYHWKRSPTTVERVAEALERAAVAFGVGVPAIVVPAIAANNGLDVDEEVRPEDLRENEECNFAEEDDDDDDYYGRSQEPRRRPQRGPRPPPPAPLLPSTPIVEVDDLPQPSMRKRPNVGSPLVLPEARRVCLVSHNGPSVPLDAHSLASPIARSAAPPVASSTSAEPSPSYGSRLQASSSTASTSRAHYDSSTVLRVSVPQPDPHRRYTIMPVSKVREEDLQVVKPKKAAKRLFTSQR